jgi:hypothetical protein
MKAKPAIFATVTATALLLAASISEAKTSDPAPAPQRSLQLNVVYTCNVEQLAAGTSPRPPQGSVPLEARVDSWLRQSGYEYRKVKANSWYVNIMGQELKQIRVLIGAGPSSIAVGAVVAPKRSLRLTADSMYKLMKLSYDLNYVRVCVDPDEDLIVMSQVKERALDLQEFKDTIERVTSAADRAYAEVRPFLSTP